MNSFLTLIFCTSIFAFSTLSAEIIETENIADIMSSVELSSLVLLDMDDTLTDSTISLGTGAWRRFIRERCDSKTHDYMTFQVAKRVPVRTVEAITPFIVYDLQIQGIPVFVLTQRGITLWHETAFQGVDTVTEDQLSSVGLDFNLTQVPEPIKLLNEVSVQRGVIYSAPKKKGPYLKELLQKSGYKPSNVVFVDDKLEQLQSVEKAMMEIGMPFTGYWYRRAEVDNRNIDQLLALIEMDVLFFDNKVISDQEARVIRDERGLTDPDALLEELVKKWTSLKF